MISFIVSIIVGFIVGSCWRHFAIESGLAPYAIWSGRWDSTKASIIFLVTFISAILVSTGIALGLIKLVTYLI